MTANLRAAGWKGPAVLGVLAGVGGLVVLGPVGGLVGLIGGAAAARRAQVVLLTAALALLAAAALTLFEEPLRDSVIYASGFAIKHDLADLAGGIAGVLLLAGLAGVLADRDSTRAPSLPDEKADGEGRRVPTSTILAVLAAGLLAVLLVWLLPS